MNRYPVFPSLEEACRFMGVIPQDVPRDDKAHPVPLEDGTSKNAGRIRLFSNNDGGWVQNWKRGADKALFFPNYGRKLSKEEYAKQQRDLNEARKEAERKTQQAFYKAKRIAEAIYSTAKPATEENPYLKLKQVEPDGKLKVIDLAELERIAKYEFSGSKGKFTAGEILIVPRGNHKNGMTTIEFIDSNGNKTFLKGGKLAGTYWLTQRIIPPANGLVIGICEGLATALSISRSAGFPVASVGGCTQFETSFINLKERFPLAQFIILGDAGNGAEYAEKTALKHGLPCCIPKFSDKHIETFKKMFGGNKTPTDFNDLEQIQKQQEKEAQK